MKFKSVVGRISYAHKFDKELEKTIEDLGDVDVNDITYAIGDSQIMAIVRYSDVQRITVKKKAVKKAS